MSKNIVLLVIDPQNDFCDPNGALYVNGAEHDMERLGKFVDQYGSKFSDIHVTMDTHSSFDIAHPIYWKDSTGKHPDPFTIISKADVESGKWMPVIPAFQQRTMDYVSDLESKGKYPLCIWNPHCLKGSTGHAVHPALYKSLVKWETSIPAIVNYVTKGTNPFTEHYSAIKAEVEDPSDPHSQINTELINSLMEADEILIAGEAGSHCVANTIFDIADEFGDDSYVSKMVLLEDCISPVQGFENLQDDFISKMTARGMKVTTTEKFVI